MSENVKPEPIPLGMAYMTDTEVVIVGHPLMDNENHNCDMMGCSSVSHVVARVPRPPEHIHAEMDSLRKELEDTQKELAWEMNNSRILAARVKELEGMVTERYYELTEANQKVAAFKADWMRSAARCLELETSLETAVAETERLTKILPPNCGVADPRYVGQGNWAVFAEKVAIERDDLRSSLEKANREVRGMVRAETVINHLMAAEAAEVEYYATQPYDNMLAALQRIASRSKGEGQ